MKNILFLLIIITLSSCADSKVINHRLYEPYGWVDYQAVKSEDIIYKANVGNIVWSILLSETIIVPIWLTGWQLYEPIEAKPKNKTLSKY